MTQINRLAGSSLHKQVKRILERKILDGELKQGDLIPSERELCEEYGVSSSPVRKALQELVREGFIRRRPGIGSFVASTSRNLNLLLFIVGFDQLAWRRYAYLFSELIGGIAGVTWENQAMFSVAYAPLTLQDTRSYLDSIIEEGTFDGILLRLAGDVEEGFLTPFFETGFPYVVIKRYLPTRAINCVINDDVQGGFMATEHLIKLGHIHIGLIYARDMAPGRDRYRGYLKALEAYGLPASPKLIWYADDFSSETGYRTAADLLAQAGRPTAIFAGSDILATGVYRAVEEAGLRIPDDVAVVGYDDIPPAATLSPPLTTVSTPYYDFGAQAASLLLDIIARRVTPPQQILIQQSLIVRESSGGNRFVSNDAGRQSRGCTQASLDGHSS